MLVTMSVTMSVIIFKKRKIMNDIKLTSDKIGKKEVKKLRQKLLKDFLHTFPLDSLQGMTLEQYTNLNKDDSFCYWPLYNENGNPRRIFQNFMNAKKGDIVIGYEANPVKQIVAIAEIDTPSDGQHICFKKS